MRYNIDLGSDQVVATSLYSRDFDNDAAVVSFLNQLIAERPCNRLCWAHTRLESGAHFLCADHNGRLVMHRGMPC